MYYFFHLKYMQCAVQIHFEYKIIQIVVYKICHRINNNKKKKTLVNGAINGTTKKKKNKYIQLRT